MPFPRGDKATFHADTTPGSLCGLCSKEVDKEENYIEGTCSTCGTRPFHFECVADYTERVAKQSNSSSKSMEKGRNIARNRPQDLFAQNRTVQRKPQSCPDRSCTGLMVDAQLIRAQKMPTAEPPAAAVLAPTKQPGPRPKQPSAPPQPKPAPTTPALARAAPPRVAPMPAFESACAGRLTSSALGSSRLGGGTADNSGATMTFAQQQLLEERQAAAAPTAAARLAGSACIQQRQAARPAMKAAATRAQQAQAPALSNYFAMLYADPPESPGREEAGEDEEAATAAAAVAAAAAAAAAPEPEGRADLGSLPQPLPLPSGKLHAAGTELAAAQAPWQDAPAEGYGAELQAALAASMAGVPAAAWHAAPRDLDEPAWAAQQQAEVMGSTTLGTGSNLGVDSSSSSPALQVPLALQQPPAAAAAPGAGFGDGYAAGLAAALRMQQEQAAQQWQQAGQQAWELPAAAAALPAQEPNSLWQQQGHYQHQHNNFQQHQHFPGFKAPYADVDDDDAEVAALLGLMGIAAG